MRLDAHLPHMLAWKRKPLRPFVPQGCDQQGRLQPTIQPAPAEACTELGAEPTQRRARMGQMTGLERYLLNRQPAHRWALLVAFAIGCAVVQVIR